MTLQFKIVLILDILNKVEKQGGLSDEIIMYKKRIEAIQEILLFCSFDNLESHVSDAEKKAGKL